MGKDLRKKKVEDDKVWSLKIVWVVFDDAAVSLRPPKNECGSKTRKLVEPVKRKIRWEDFLSYKLEQL